MGVKTEKLYDEKKTLVAEFDTLKANIVKVESELGKMKSNLNALAGAVQFADKLINISEQEKAMAPNNLDLMVKPTKISTKKEKGKR
tara:strand:- start:209 stop:469 length:261 start_codon:yes stop_codon:yes gene_type:complete